MDHTEAVEQMATERYLLDELTPEQREAFEEHLFDCQDCALDLQAGTAFVEEAKAQLPALTADLPRRESAVATTPRKGWFSFFAPIFRPALAAPVFAAMLVIIGYQNLVVLPRLQVASMEPRLAPWTSLHTATRGAASTVVEADAKSGVVLLVDLPTQPDFTSYAFDLADPDGKTAFTRTIAAPQENADANDGTQSLVIPGAGLHAGAYTLTVFGVTSSGARTEIQRHVLDLQLKK